MFHFLVTPIYHKYHLKKRNSVFLMKVKSYKLFKKFLRIKLNVIEWTGVGDHERVHRQLSVSSDSKLLDEDIREEARVILRPRRPPRPKSEVFLGPDPPPRRTKRFSAFGVSEYFYKYFFLYRYTQYTYKYVI